MRGCFLHTGKEICFLSMNLFNGLILVPHNVTIRSGIQLTGILWLSYQIQAVTLNRVVVSPLYNRQMYLEHIIFKTF